MNKATGRQSNHPLIVGSASRYLPRERDRKPPASSIFPRNTIFPSGSMIYTTGNFSTPNIPFKSGSSIGMESTGKV